MTPAELFYEYNVEYQTALGMMCDNQEPTTVQSRMAKVRAEWHIKELDQELEIQMIEEMLK